MKIFSLFLLLTLSGHVVSKPDHKNFNTLSLENLERERAAFISDLLDPALGVQERITKVTKRQRHLTDIERMVMRDERLLTAPSKWVKNAFDNYESTFLVHAGAEKNLEAKEYWLTRINLTNESVFDSKPIFRKH